MKSTSLRLAVLVLVVIVIVGAAFVAGHWTGQATTRVVVRESRTSLDIATPWTPAGGLSASDHVTARTTGSCWTGSIAVDDSDAWRCDAGNDIYDPCFSAPVGAHPREVACLASPWGDVVLLTLTSALPAQSANPSPSGATPPFTWAVALTNGARCVIGTGTNGELGGVALDYYCNTGALAGAIDTSSEPWTIEYDARGANRLVPQAITTAWGG